MPTYEFKCSECGKIEERLLKMSDNISIMCINCFQNGKSCQMIKGVGGGTAVHFKGSGFYETDYKK